MGLPGPEQVFAVHLRKPVANFGVRVVSQARNVEVTPRVVRDGDENRLTGYPGLPGDLNPYRESLGDTVQVVGAILPGSGTYDIVFDSAGRVNAGGFTFRFWLNDVTPPAVKLLGYRSGVLRLAISDRGSGVDPGSIIAGIDGNSNVNGSYAKGVLSDPHRLALGRQAHGRGRRLRLPGVEEHGGRPADPPEHARLQDVFHRPLTASGEG